MERGNSKHGPLHDEELARETEGMVRGQPQRAHAEEWRETEPVDGALPPIHRAGGADPRPSGRDLELRTEFARLMTRDKFPARREAVLRRLTDADAAPDLIDKVMTLPPGSEYATPHDALVALGINSPETGGRRSPSSSG